ncbi:MAG TPA: hypothetical protein DIT07_16885 [Sphingobacteriaceae bacterium]|nr:hypothetical protein [Sphingobacteriaceae bacterium]
MSESHIFVLQQVIDDLLNTNSSLESALLKLNYFARLIKNEELLQFTDLEINGYKEVELPQYRKAISTLTAKMQAWQTYHTGEIPISMLEEPFNETLRYLGVYEGVKVLESMVSKSTKNNSPLLIKHLPMEMLSYVQPLASKIYLSDVKIVVVEAWITANANIVTQILSTVRSRLLAFTMEIAERFGYNIKISSFKQEQDINNQTINNFIRNEIINHGNGNITNTGSDSNLTAEITT